MRAPVTEHPAGGSLRYVPALDGLRAVAVLGVMLFHAGFVGGGWAGVQMFFVLSGFLISTILIGDRGEPLSL
jgi:peptidoglycan/LPS O-acetylase OafA/YrhL